MVSCGCLALTGFPLCVPLDVLTNYHERHSLRWDRLFRNLLLHAKPVAGEVAWVDGRTLIREVPA